MNDKPQRSVYCIVDIPGQEQTQHEFPSYDEYHKFCTEKQLKTVYTESYPKEDCVIAIPW